MANNFRRLRLLWKPMLNDSTLIQHKCYIISETTLYFHYNQRQRWILSQTFSKCQKTLSQKDNTKDSWIIFTGNSAMPFWRWNRYTKKSSDPQKNAFRNENQYLSVPTPFAISKLWRGLEAHLGASEDSHYYFLISPIVFKL